MVARATAIQAVRVAGDDAHGRDGLPLGSLDAGIRAGAEAGGEFDGPAGHGKLLPADQLARVLAQLRMGLEAILWTADLRAPGKL